MSGSPLFRLFTWLGHELSLARLLTLALLLVGLNGVAIGLATLIQGVELSLLLSLALLGLLLAWGLAASPWPGWAAGLLTTALGFIMVVGQVGRLGQPILTWLAALLKFAWRWQGGDLFIPPLPLLLWARLQVLWGRLWEWLAGVATGAPSYDPVAVAVIWGGAVWLAAAWAGWMVRRRDHPLLGMLPAGVLLVITQAYVGGSFAFLLLLLATTWLLLAQVSQAARERRWQAQAIDFSLEIRLDLAVVVIFSSVSLMTLAGIAPSFSLRQAAELAQRLIWGQPVSARPVADSLGLKPPPGQPAAFDKVLVGGLPRRHLLGSGPELSQQMVMIVKPAAPSLNYRWRGLTYDRYTGQGWLTGQIKTTAYPAGEPVDPHTFEVSKTSKVLIRQEIQTVGDLDGLVYAAGALQTVDRDYSVAWRSNGDAFGATVEAAAYQADSLLPQVAEAQLRAAGQAYPAWVRRRYLALPANLPERVLTLARDLTAVEPTPYDRAKAIERYLRAIPYNLNIPVPPSGRDVVDYFLFDLRQGYCDYYASAMVVLARAAGLPARLVVGYAAGRYDPAGQRYLVTQADAHSWPEIYFPQYGWIEFEPTASRPAFDLPSDIQPSNPPAESEIPPLSSPVMTVPAFYYWGWSLAAGLATLGLVGLITLVIDSWRLRHAPPGVAVERLYRRLRRVGQRLTGPIEAGDTPYEFSLALQNRLHPLVAHPRWRRWLAPAAEEIGQLTDLYLRAAYSPHPPTPAEGSRAVQAWLRLRWRLGLAYVILLLVNLMRPKARG